MAKDSNIWKFTGRLCVSFCLHCSFWLKTATFESSQRGDLCFSHHCLLWEKTATFGSSQRGYLCHLATTVHCGQRPQHLRVHREEIRAVRPSQLIVTKDTNIWEFTERLFVSFGHHISLWSKTATFESSQRGNLFFSHNCSLWEKTATFESSQRGYLCHLATTVHCGQKPQHLRVHREEIRALRPSQFIVTKDTNIWEFTVRLFVSFGHHISLWSKTATVESSQRGYLCHSATIVHCGQRLQHLRVHREAIHGQRPP